MQPGPQAAGPSASTGSEINAATGGANGPLHHRHERGRYNYGVLVDVWDRLLGTYKSYGWQRPPDYRFSLAGLLDIKWI